MDNGTEQYGTIWAADLLGSEHLCVLTILKPRNLNQSSFLDDEEPKKVCKNAESQIESVCQSFEIHTAAHSSPSGSLKSANPVGAMNNNKQNKMIKGNHQSQLTNVMVFILCGLNPTHCFTIYLSSLGIGKGYFDICMVR